MAADGGPLDLDQAYKQVKRFHDHRPELVNVTLIAPDGAVLLSAKFPPGTCLLPHWPGSLRSSRTWKN